MYYDHFLAKDWRKYCDVPIEDFTARIYDVLKSAYDILPARSKYMLPYMMADNWLMNYRNLEGLNQALTGISRRTTFPSGLETAVDYLKDHYDEHQESFDSYFPQLVERFK